MADEEEWLEVTLDSGNRRGLAEGLELRTESNGAPELTRLLRMLRASRNELLLDRAQARLVLDFLNVDRRMSALRARLEAFLDVR
jgi:hypothetical protein